jgi:hypothetical protein
MTDPGGQAHMNMHLAVAIGKGVQLDAAQTAAIFALIADQQQEIEELRDRLRDLRGERAAVVAWLHTRPGYGPVADCIERGEHRREEE